MAAAVTAVPTAATLTDIEALSLTSGGAITADFDTTGLAGLATITTNGAAAQTITGSATQGLNVTGNLTAAANDATVNGGNNVTVTVTGITAAASANASLIVVGGTTAAKGDVVVNATAKAGADTLEQGTINVTGGKTITVTSKLSNTTKNETNVHGAVSATGNADTTAVTVTQDATATAAATIVGKTAGAVTVADANAASGTDAGTITTVTLNNYGASTIDSSAIATVNLSGTGGTLGVGRGALTATPTENTLALNVSGLTGGVITDSEAAADDGFTTINVAGSGTASTIAGLTAADLKTLNVSGDAKVTFTAQTLAAATAINVTNTAGASFGTALGNSVVFTGGAGADTVSVGATTKAISMGGGDDKVTISADVGAGGSISGGDGTDTLVLNVVASTFATPSAQPRITGFETLGLGALANGSYNAAGFTGLTQGAVAAATTFTNVAAGAGLTLTADAGFAMAVTLADATGTADTFDVTLSSDAAQVQTAALTLAGIETVNVASVDTNTTAHANTVTLTAAAAKTVNVSGNAGLVLTATGSTAVTAMSASGVVLGKVTDTGVTYTSLNVTVGEDVTITGSNGVDALTGTATTNDTINGGAGVDTITYNGSSDVFTGGAGNDVFEVDALGTKTVHLTIADLSAGDKIDLAGVDTGTATWNATEIELGASATLDNYLDAAVAGDGSTNSIARWFQHGGNTYIVNDNTAGATFAATDSVIEITGLVELKDSTLATTFITVV